MDRVTFLFISLTAWLLTFVMLKYPGRNKIRFWYSMYVLTAAMGTLDVSLTKEILPFLMADKGSIWLIYLTKVAAYFLNTIWIFMGTLTVFETLHLNSAVEYNRSAKLARYGFVGIYSGIIIFNFLTHQSFLELDPEKSTAYPFFCWMSVVVCMWGVGILVSSYFTEKLEYLKRKRLSLIFEICPLLLVMIFMVYVTPLIWGIAFVSENKFIGLAVDTIIGYLVIQHFLLVAREKFQNKNNDSSIKTAYSGISLYNHAIKNQLANILMSVENLKNNRDDRHIDRYSEVVKDSVNHLLEISQRLQSKMQEMTLTLSVSDLSLIVEDSLQSMAPFLAEKDISLSTKLTPALMVLIDPVHFHEVLCCIFKNAIEAMDESGNLVVYSDIIAGDIGVSIIDDGPGIPRHHLRRVYEPYFTTKGNYGNFGLGLSYCQNVMRKHKGHIRINSREGMGTQVDLLLPPLKRPFIRRHRKTRRIVETASRT